MGSQTQAVTTAHEHSSSQITTNEAAPNKAEVQMHSGGPRRSKYRHVAAYHSQLRHSSLSRDSDVTPSFLGFRNLMVLVLGKELTMGGIMGSGRMG